ncbi:MAG: hypothetical protein Q8L27_01660, partial [archaeon]|nr:hypothetical protein [archaeon]
FKIAEMSEVVMQKEPLMQGRQPLPKIDEKETHNLKFDIEDLKHLAERDLKDKKVEKNLEEIIAVLQNIENILVWHLTCVAAGFTVVSVIIDVKTGETIKYEKKNIMDFVSVKKPGEKLEEKK